VKKSLIWTTAAIAAIGFGVPAFAAISTPGSVPQIAPTPVVSVASPDNTLTSNSVETSVSVPSTPSTPVTSSPDDNTTANSVEDVSGNCDEAEHANDAACAGVNTSGTTDDSTENSVEDVSGNCDEAEHAADPSCTGTGTAVDDNSGHGSDDNVTSNSVSNRGHGSDNSGSDDSGHGSNDG
jgi:hypothetical protein